MEIQRSERESKIIKLYVVDESGREIGRASLVLVWNDLHKEPYGMLEDVFVDEKLRGGGVGADLVRAVIDEAENQKCHKLICTSRFGRDKLHKWYEKFGFKEHGIEFRMDF